MLSGLWPLITGLLHDSEMGNERINQSTLHSVFVHPSSVTSQHCLASFWETNNYLAVNRADATGQLHK